MQSPPSELVIDHRGGEVHIRIRGPDGEHEATRPFACEIAADERALLQWYLEEYLLHPYGPYRDRAVEAEAKLEEIGERLFGAVFGDVQSARPYEQVVDALDSCRLIVEPHDGDGWTIPWELLRDAERKSRAAA